MLDGVEGSVKGLRSAWAPDQVAERLVALDSEYALLSALLVRNELMPDLPESFKAEHYSVPDHQTIHKVIAGNHEAGEASFAVFTALASIDPVLRDRAKQIAMSMIGTEKGYVRTLCLHITGMYRRRMLVETADRLTVNAGNTNERNIQPAISRAMSDLEEIAASVPSGRQGMSLATALDDVLDDYERTARGEITGISTGFASLDNVIGRMDGGAVYVIGGRPGSGKSSLGLQIALNVAQQGNGVCFISLEMQAKQLARRAAAYLANVPQWKIKKARCSQAEMDALIRCRKEIHELPFTIEEQGGLNTQAIAIRAKAADRKHGLKLLVVDHIHIVGTPAETTRMGATWAVEQVSKALKRIAKDMDIPVLALAQLNRGVEGRDDKHPSMADLRQSGSIEEDAEAIMLLYRPEYYLPDVPPEKKMLDTDAKHQTLVDNWEAMRSELAGKAEVIFEKVRDGETQTVLMHFDGQRTCFEEVQ